MNQLQYQQLVFGYHGCDISVRDKVLRGEGELAKSKNTYDWLGSGIYFWEHGMGRAMDWAQQLKLRGRIDEPAVLGAVIQLGRCFDLLDVEYTTVLAHAYPDFIDSLASSNAEIPQNKRLGVHDPDFLLRTADCALVNWTIDGYEKETGLSIQSVRGIFQEGVTIFPDSGIRMQSHIQIAVRDTSCIVGYFLPH